MKTLPPCVYLKHGSYWYVKRAKWTKLGSDFGSAMAEYGRIIETPTGGMAALVDEALAVAKTRVKASTYRQYVGVGDVVKRRLINFAPEQVRAKHIARIKKDMHATPPMANRVLTVLRLVFTYAVEEERCESNPCYGIKPYPEKKRDRLITLDEWIAIYWCAGERLQLIMRMAYLTGQRIGDVLGLQTDQIQPEGVEFDQGKTGAKLLVRWSPELRAAVADAQAYVGSPSLTLFRSRNGGTPDYRSVHEQWTRACKLAGVKNARPNDQRAQSATETKRQGKDATALLGHTSEKMTDRYLRDRQRPTVDGPSFSVH